MKFVADKLLHGFLNFHVFRNEAHEGCDLLISSTCTELIHQLCLTTLLRNK